MTPQETRGIRKKKKKDTATWLAWKYNKRFGKMLPIVLIIIVNNSFFQHFKMKSCPMVQIAQ